MKPHPPHFGLKESSALLSTASAKNSISLSIWSFTGNLYSTKKCSSNLHVIADYQACVVWPSNITLKLASVKQYDAMANRGSDECNQSRAGYGSHSFTIAAVITYCLAILEPTSSASCKDAKVSCKYSNGLTTNPQSGKQGP
ncbi:hypothetical protein V6N13_060025 [Hibiscus sabdariffa]|uniref:Uncharacterized protein n=1 Tax=Hibiscus sabdariffa TaxID=183260 RepID=A0ABR2GBH0_9ROSI